ncbi:MAG TPA: metallophosphoesterase [Tangfeifania sp.]|nr:metallophosphoesterase [Tangfeifania sp.]
MFHIYITLAYIIPNIYVFFRIKNLFISKKYRPWYIAVYLLLALIFPVSHNFLRHNPDFVSQFFTTVAGYILPFFLYLFLSVLVFDLILLLNLIFKFVSAERRKSYSFRRAAFSSILFISAATVIGGVVNINTIRVSNYNIVVPKKNSDMENLRVAFVADFHIQQNTRLGFVKQFVRKVEALQPDIILYGGDIVEGRGENATSVEIESALKRIQTKYGAFGVLGNHEFYAGQDDGIFFEQAGITLLNDSVIRINDSFYLAGRYDEHFRKRKTVHEVLGNNPADLPLILLDHRPTQLQEVSQTPVDAQFSGHTHNGQLFPLNFIIGRMYELSWGYRKTGNTHFFVTSGLRLWGPPVKTAGKSEIMLVNFRFE